jgi:CPA1 family monovalent cation:H+ antiporter
MALFELVIGLLLVGSVLALLADRLSIPYPALLALVGTALALVPAAPSVRLDPSLALALFVAPTLLDAAYDASPRDLRRNLGAVVALALVMVVLTVVGVAFAARQVVPQMGWPAAVALGAIVAPPDASAATAVLRKLRPPHRLMVILDGESLFNDATALVLYRLAVGTAMTGTFSGWSVVPSVLLTSLGGVGLGWALAHVQIWANQQIDDFSIDVLLQFIGTFAVWMLADRLGLSPIITLVTFAMTLARRVAGRIEARRRIASYAVWDVAVLVLNVLAFVLIGLQLRGVAERVHGAEWGVYAACAGAVCAAVVLVRFAWVITYVTGVRWKARRFEAKTRDPATLPTHRNGLLAAWCGMRGIVTLATALALPAAFSRRDLIVFCAFCVVVGSLVVQGLTVRPLMLWLGIHDDGAVEREIRVARIETARAAIFVLEHQGEVSASSALLRDEYRARLDAEESSLGRASAGVVGASVAALQRRAVFAQREALRALRARSVIGDDAFHVVEEEIDLLELTADARVPPRGGGAG